MLVISIIVFNIYFYTQNSESKEQQKTNVIANTFKHGLTGDCRAIPKFLAPLKMRSPSLDSRQQDGSMGLQIRDVSGKNKAWQHNSWKKSGYIGAFDRDRTGNIYISPMPYVSLQKNPPNQQNQIYIIDAKTAEMTLFMKLPSENLPSTRNPFGSMGVYYDCDTNSLYVATLAGSMPMQEKGAILQIDLNTKQIISKLDNVDAIGVGVFNTNKGKRLYYGSARGSNLFSVPLDGEGHFAGKQQYELSLSQIKGGDSTVIKKVSFNKKKGSFFMTLKDIEFGFRLLAENNPYKRKYHFKWDETEGNWNFEGLTTY